MITDRTDAVGRNEWAQKCGYITTHAMLNIMNSEGTYIVFSNGRAGGGSGDYDVPVRAEKPCNNNLIKQGFCYTGCYAPSQKMDFFGEVSEISHAYSKNIQEVNALSADSRSDDILMNFAPQKIKSYVAGETKEDLIHFTSDLGNQLSVTFDHPLVGISGNIIKAKDLHEGNYLLAADGRLARIISKRIVPFEGKVWNIRPLSQNKRENILIADGILTGSHRFQSQWSDDITRLYFRTEADISGL
jgi:hypothetical protein